MGQLSSIEKLNVANEDKEWTLINMPGFTYRHKPLVCTMDEESFLIAGGTDGYSGYFVDSSSVSMESRAINTLTSSNSLTFQCCRDTGTAGAPGEAFAIVESEDLKLHIVHFSANNILVSIKRFEMR